MSKMTYSERLERLARIGIFLGVTAISYFILGCLGFISSRIVNIITATVAALLSFYSLTVLRSNNRARSLAWFVLVAVLLLICALVTVLSLTPPIARDELIHHLAIPRLYVESGAVIELPIARYSYYPMLLDMLYTPWLALGYEGAAKLMHGVYAIFTALLIFSYLSYRLDEVWGLLGSLVFLSTPIVFRMANVAYVDLGLTFYSAAAFLCLLRWGEDASNQRFLIYASLLAGMAAASKPNGAIVVAILLLAALVVSQKKDGEINKNISPFRAAALFAILSCVAVTPWLIRNYTWTGNPFYPFLRGFFPGGPVLESSLEPVWALNALTKRLVMYGESLWQVLLLPIRVFFFGEDDNPRLFDGRLSPILLVFLPFAFAKKLIREKTLIAVFAALYFFLALLLTDFRARYVLPAMPFFAILSIFGIEKLAKSTVFRIPAFVATGIFFAINGQYAYEYTKRISALEYVFGDGKQEEYLRKKLPDYSAIEFVNSSTPSNSLVYLVFNARKSYYLRRGFFHDEGELPMFLLSSIKNARDGGEIALQLKSKRITHLLIRNDLLSRFLNDNANEGERARWSEFVNQFGKLVFQDRVFSVFDLYNVRQEVLSSEEVSGSLSSPTQ